MKRLAAPLVALLILAGMVTPATSSERNRTASSEYDIPNGVAVWLVVDTAFSYDDVIAKVHSFRVMKRERTVNIAIRDDSGLMPQGHVNINDVGPPDGIYFCGETEDPLEVTPGDQVNVLVLGGICPGGSPAFATSGLVEARFGR